ncbi:Fimbriae usher protein StcC [Klebsiella pneumoniae]|nr:Fimbriae usher protein StcC [Klebsiella pneumoniae]
MALIEAKDAAGAMLPGSPGTRIDSNGYAILPYLRPYRINSVEIDPKGSNDDVAFGSTVAQVVPWEGSVVVVGQGSMMFISDASAPKATVKWSGGQCSVELSQEKTKETLCR